ncbi:CoA-binding protein [Sporichthya sp.]|uniref:CoA-binding protein n=1 Tax=Sporichthya sp. TaxID=65475 RepID=UPI0017FD1315|nr:CoA-binding protein [Sporichthya sp.]MBA3741435.1 CoA-binding protein [Sporichthya sp.]
MTSPAGVQVRVAGAKSISELLFAPASIAIVGASNDPAKLSGRPLDYLRTFGFAGSVYAVNPLRPEVQGIATYPSVTAIGAPVDLAVIVVPAGLVPAAVADCAQARVGVAIVFASGFAEAAAGGADLQSEVDAAMAGSSLRLLGPNCLGSFALPAKAFATFSSAFDEATAVVDEPIALVTQSGAVGTFIYSTFARLGGGVRYFANPGNEADLTVPDLLLDLAGRDDVDILAGHLEGLRRPDVLREAAATARAADKPMILIKAGRTPEGGRAVAAHTASDPGDDEAFAELARAEGIVRVDGMESMVDTLLVFRPRRRAGGRRVTMVTQSGGAGALAADATVHEGLDLAPWSASDRRGLEQCLPAFGSAQNPIDVTGRLLTDPALLQRVLAEVVAHDSTDVVLVLLGNSDRGADVIVEGLTRAYESTVKPFVAVWTGGNGWARQELLRLGVPTYTDPTRAVRAIGHLVRFSESRASGVRG